MPQSKASPPRSSSASETSIGPEAHLEGNLKGKTNVRLFGTLEGDIIVEGGVVVGEGAQVNGDISADRVVVEGNVYGDVEARDTVHLGSSAKIKGNIRTNAISIQEGAWFEGSVTEKPAAGNAQANSRPDAAYQQSPVYQ